MTIDRSPFRYVRWIAEDIFVWPFRMMLVVCVIIDVLVWRFANGSQTIRGPGRVPVDMPHGLQMIVWGTGLTVVTLMTIGGIVGTDLERGYYRAWFSKPMSPMWFYLQRFIAGGIAVLLLPLVLGAGLALALHGNMGLSADLMTQVALGYLLVGGATLLASIFTSRGWLLVFLLAFMQNTLAGFDQLNTLPAWLLSVHAVLPPFQLVRASLAAPHGSELSHVLGYGLGMVAVSLALLRFRPLGNGVTT